MKGFRRQTAKPQVVDGAPVGLYVVWVLGTGLALAAAWSSFFLLKRRERFLSSVLRLQEAAPTFEDFESQARALCEACSRETGAMGTTLYLQPGRGETGFRRAAQVGQSAEETGPGVVRDLLTQAWETGKPTESSYSGRWIMAVPVWPGHEGGGALLLFWEEALKPGEGQRRLVEVVSSIASLMAPRFEREGALARAQEHIQNLQQEVAEESHLASVGRLAAGVAHELNTPLGAVLAMVSSLQRLEEDPNRAKRLKIMREAVEKCKSIIEKLLVYSREPVETEQGLTFSRFVRSETDLNRVIENTVELLSETLGQDGVQIKLDLQQLPPFRANSTQWSHVFNNLLINARDALKGAGTESPLVTIRSRSATGRIVVEVFDNGPGIPEDIRKKIFQPFFTTKDIGKGTGLGLAICSEVVRKHQGSINIGQTPEGGALFTIQLPLS